MTAPALTPLLHEVLRLAEDSALHPLSDRELIERFAAHDDPSAFEVLVRRHGPLVLAACRRVLGNEADADDAFQATFLTLLRKAKSVSWRESVAGWLSGTAHHIAVRARAGALRRRRHEAEARLRTRDAAPIDLTWREAVGVLHEELDRLPERFRLPLLLCYLEGHSREEAAAALGWSAGAVKGRLERGRAALRRRLARRGLTLSAGLLAALASPPARAVPAHLLRSTVHAATAGPSPAVVALLGGSGKLAALLVLALSLLGAGVGIAAYRLAPAGGPPPSKHALAKLSAAPAAAPPASAPEEAADKVAVRGRVLDPDGKPVANARLFWPRLRRDRPASEGDSELAPRARTDRAGGFRLELPGRKVRLEHDFKLVALAEGYGMGWAELPGKGRPAEVTVRLVKDQPIRGRLLDTEGRPGAGAEVAVEVVFASRDGKLDEALARWKKDWRGAFYPGLPEQLRLPQAGKLYATKTGKDGRFVVKGVGAERVAKLAVRRPGIAQAVLSVVTRAGFDPEPFNRAAQEQIPPEYRRPGVAVLHGTTLNLVAAPERPIEGTVRAARTGKPLTGVRVCYWVDSFRAEAVTDAKGRYRLLGLPKWRRYFLFARPPEGSTYLPADVSAPDEPGYAPLRVDLKMAEGVVVTGRVIDKATGKGVRGWVQFIPLPENKYLNRPPYVAHKGAEFSASMRADGTFRLVALPGPGVLAVQAHTTALEGELRVDPYRLAHPTPAQRKRLRSLVLGGLYHVLEPVDLAEGGGPVKCELKVDPGKTLTVRVQDTEGKPLAGAVVSGATASWPMTFPLKEARCTVYALGPKEPRRILFYHPQRNLAGTLTVRGEDKGARVVKLRPAGAVRGRLLDLEGKPRAGVEVSLFFNEVVANELYRHLDQRRVIVHTDREGRFRLEGVVPGARFHLNLRQDRTFLDTRPRLGDKEVEAGKALDLDDLRTKPDR
jgi:RNA polymerase sigma factor (sigma-70 family)